MWLIGTIIAIVVGAAMTVAVGWAPRATSSPPIWDLPKAGAGLGGNARTFAGFSLTAAIFIAGVEGARTSPSFATVFGMMLVGFLVLVVASWLGGSIPDLTRAEDAITPSLGLVLANMCTNLGVGVTWAALLPLLSLFGLSWLVGVFIWWLLVMVVVAGVWSALIVYRVTSARFGACLFIPALSLGLPALYRLVAARRWPALWPASDAALHFAFVALGAAALLFAFHTGLLFAYGSAPTQSRLQRHGYRLALGSTQAYTIVVAFLWFAVVLP